MRNFYERFSDSLACENPPELTMFPAKTLATILSVTVNGNGRPVRISGDPDLFRNEVNLEWGYRALLIHEAFLLCCIFQSVPCLFNGSVARFDWEV